MKGLWGVFEACGPGLSEIFCISFSVQVLDVAIFPLCALWGFSHVALWAYPYSMFLFSYEASLGSDVRLVQVAARSGTAAGHEAWSSLPPGDWSLVLVSVEQVEEFSADDW